MRRLPLVAVLALAACGDNLEGLTLDQLEAARRAAECERYVRCGLFDDEATCTATFRAQFDPALPAAVDAGKIRFDPLAAAQCNKDLAARGCDVTAADTRALPASCARVLVGTIPAGATCLDDRECATGDCDAPRCTPDACCPGGCVAFAAPAAIGEACTARVGCVAGAACATDDTCHALAAMGDACRADGECAIGLACIGATELQAGNCRALPKLGESCPYQRCAEIGARCEAGTCVAVGLAGDACTDDSACSEFYTCDATQHCARLPGLGEACTGRCAGEAYCDLDPSGSGAGTCRSPQPNAAPCSADDQCATQYCEEGPIFDQCAQPALCF